MSTPTTTTPSTTPNSSTSHHTPSSTSSTKIQSAKQNLTYLLNPKTGPAPSKRSTRALLRTSRYILTFLFWRLVRYAKYAAIGAISAAVAGTAIGTLTGGLGFILAPTGILGGAGVGLVWGLGKFGWRTLAARVRSGRVDGVSAREDERNERETRAERVDRRVEGRVLADEPW